jgi:hypothetical protein
MTGDQIRAMEFPVVFRGYESAPVSDLLRLLEAGFSPAIIAPRPGLASVMRGYGPQAVDRFLGTLPSVSTKERSPGEPANPWRVAYGEAEPQDSPDPQAWVRVPGLPGSRLRRIPGWPGSKILGSHGEVLMTCRGTTLTLGVGGRRLRNDWNKQIADAGTGDPILRGIGSHRFHQARAVVLQRGQRWHRFPVQGTGLRSGVMTALDEPDTEVLWFRKTEQNVMEAVISPACDLTPEILCVPELADSWLNASCMRDGGQISEPGTSRCVRNHPPNGHRAHAPPQAPGPFQPFLSGMHNGASRQAAVPGAGRTGWSGTTHTVDARCARR